MPIETVTRAWTIATWLVAGFGDRTELLARELDGAAADIVLIQSVGERDLEQLAAALGLGHRWSRSHFPVSRLFPGSAVGLGVLSPHRITETAEVVTSSTSSMWSKHRRTMQLATIEREDRSGYAVRHAVGAMPDLAPGGAPLVSVHPARIEGDARQAIELPATATVVSHRTTRPVASGAELLVVRFEMPWVRGDFEPVS